MEKAEFKYFLNGEEVDGDLINWEYSTSITSNGSEIYVDYAPEDADNIYNYFEGSLESVFEDIFGSLLLNKLLEGTQFNNYLPNTNTTVGCNNDSSDMCEAAPNSTGTEAGVKYNKHKAPLDIVQTRQFPKALQALALATAFGNKKYEATDKDFLNFKRVSGGSQTYFDASARHNAERYDIDADSGLPHVVHAVWNAMAALEIAIEESGIDIKEFSKNYLENLHM